MQKITEAKDLQKAAEDSVASYDDEAMAVIITALKEYVAPKAIEDCNRGLAKGKHKTLDYDLLAKIAYIHSRSVIENDGYSPTARIQAYLKKTDGIEIHLTTLKIATDLLLKIKYLILLSDYDRKKKQSRCYRLDYEIKDKLIPLFQ